MTAQMTGKTHEFWMEEALREAQRAFAAGEVPIGAVVICEGRIVGRGCNLPISLKDPTAHAEIVALRKAGIEMQNYRLSGCDLYVTTEPCTMCAGAIVHARIRTLIYGTADPKAGAVTSTSRIFENESLNHRVQVIEGVSAGRSGELLQTFFRARRAVTEK